MIGNRLRKALDDWSYWMCDALNRTDKIPSMFEDALYEAWEIDSAESGSLIFTVPGAPVPCARARIVKGHAFTPEKTKHYQHRVMVYAIQAMRACGWKPNLKGPFECRLSVYRAADRGDADNYAKSCWDGMTKAGVWADDKYVHRSMVEMLIDRENPRVEVVVRLIEQEKCNDV